MGTLIEDVNVASVIFCMTMKKLETECCDSWN